MSGVSDDLLGSPEGDAQDSAAACELSCQSWGLLCRQFVYDLITKKCFRCVALPAIASHPWQHCMLIA